jgi:O-acetyl-ADP-ribose deacetylase (regulator of RNase III)
VSSTSTKLEYKSGVAKAVAEAAGERLKNECQKYLQTIGCLKVTEVMHTTAGNLAPGIRHVIHAAAPVANITNTNSVGLQTAVEDTYFNCLRHANNNLEATSISIPTIGSGTFNVSDVGLLL